jgi:hypothetical protein
MGGRGLPLAGQFQEVGPDRVHVVVALQLGLSVVPANDDPSRDTG